MTKEINSISNIKKIQVSFLLLEELQLLSRNNTNIAFKDKPIDYTKSYTEVTLCFSYKLFYYLSTISGTLAVTLDILCHMKFFKFLQIFELLHVVSEHKVQTLGLNVAQLAYVEQ